jgi:hypothetical protein
MDFDAPRRSKMLQGGMTGWHLVSAKVAGVDGPPPRAIPHVSKQQGCKILIVVPTDGIRGRCEARLRAAPHRQGVEVCGGRDRQRVRTVLGAACGYSYGTNCYSSALGKAEEYYEVDASCGRDLHRGFADYGRAASERWHRTAYQERHA